MGDDRCRPGLKPQRLGQYFLEFPRTSQDPPRTLRDSPKQSLKNACGIGQNSPKTFARLPRSFPRQASQFARERSPTSYKLVARRTRALTQESHRNWPRSPLGICTISRRKPPQKSTNMPKNPQDVARFRQVFFKAICPRRSPRTGQLL